ncbi:MAG: MBL fold metallo-hydrolase [Candidatus Omnitrophota bacterium]
MLQKHKSDYWIKFLGTAGARFVMIKQLRASGGLWVRAKDMNILIDPGPGSIVRCSASKPKLDPTKLDAVVLTHRHLDHSNDVNVMLEAMTEGGFKKRGVLFLPEDAITNDSIVLNHVRDYVGKIEILKGSQNYMVGDFSFQTSQALKHPCQTYGLKFMLHNISCSLLADTEYFEGLSEFFKTDIVIINLVFLEPHPGVQHLNLQDVKEIVCQIRPKKTILTHFGMSMLKANPFAQAKKLSWETGLDVVAASDGMTVEI